MDKKDKAILAALDFDGRAMLSKIAKQTRSSKQLVKYRLDELMRRGIVKHTYAHIDYFKLGYSNFNLFIKLKNVTKRKEEAIVQYINSLTYPKRLYTMGGQWDIFLEVWVSDNREFAKIINKIHRRYGSNILKKDISIATRFTYFAHSYIHGYPQGQVSAYLHTDTYELNKRDMMLLHHLEREGRMPNTQIAAKVGYSPETVRRKIKEFQKNGIIMAFRTEIDSSQFDFWHFKLFIRLRTRTTKRIEEFIRYLEELDNVLYVSKTIEMSEMELNIFAKNHSKFYEVVNKIKYSFPDLMEDYYWNVAFLVS
ncbi:MAG: Lrp/AsnC family transcriptional regulator [Nanobdellota archaeon]